MEDTGNTAVFSYSKLKLRAWHGAAGDDRGGKNGTYKVGHRMTRRVRIPTQHRLRAWAAIGGALTALVLAALVLAA
ncbi:MAG: hypothetical protein WBB34_04000, partial [Xanthobacteraceae bacterium]